MARTRQPQGPVRPVPGWNWVVNFNAGSASPELISSARGTTGGSPISASYADGVGIKFASASSQYWQGPVAGMPTTFPITLVTSFVVNDLSVAARIFTSGMASNYAGLFLWVSPTGTVELGYGNNTSDYTGTSSCYLSTATGSVVVGKKCSLAAVVKSGSIECWLNGVRVSTEAVNGTATTIVTVGSPLVGRLDYSSGSYYSDATVGLVALGNTDTPSGQLSGLSLNPWQLFAPPRRLWVQLGAASGGAGVTVEPIKGALTLTGYLPAIAQPHVVAPAVGHATLTGYTPGIEQDKAVAPAKGALTLTGYVPTLTQPRSIAVVKGTLTLTGYVPAVQQTASGTIAPSKGTLTLTGYAPGIEQDRTVAPAKGALVVTGGQPGIVQNVTTFIAPSKGTLALAGYEPSISSTANQAIAPTAGTLTLAGYAPVLAQTGAQIIGPVKGALTLAGYAPTVQVIGAGVTIVEPSAGALALAGYAPLIGLILAADALDSTRLIDRDPARLGASRIGPPVVNRDDYPFGTPTPPQRRPRLG